MKNNTERTWLILKGKTTPLTTVAEHIAKIGSITGLTTVDHLVDYGIYWFEQNYPGLQVPPVVSGETAPANAARDTVFTAFKTAVDAGSGLLLKDTTFENPFYQYRLDSYMATAIATYQAANPRWDSKSYALKYSDATVTKYAYPTGLKDILSFKELNAIIDMAKEVETYPVKYAEALPSTPTIINVLNESPILQYAPIVGVDLAKVKAVPVSANGEISYEQALFAFCRYLYNKGQTVADIYTPVIPEANLLTYGLDSQTIQSRSLSKQDVAFVYYGAKTIEAALGNAGSSLEIIRNKDLSEAFENNATLLAAATQKQKAGKMMIVFYNKTRAMLAKQESGIVMPKPYLRYFDSKIAKETAAVTALKLSENDLFNGKEDAFTAAVKIQQKLISTEFAVADGANAYIDTNYPKLKALAAAEITAIGGAATANFDAKAEIYAYYIATADIGLRPRSKADILSFFPGNNQRYLISAKITERCFAAIQKLIDANKTFRFNEAHATEFGLTFATATHDQIAKPFFAKQYAESKIAKMNALYKLPIVDHMKALGVTDDALSKVNLNFAQIQENPAFFNTEVVGNMLFTSRYGKACLVTAASCTTGWADKQARAEIIVPHGLTQKIAMAKKYSLLEVLKLVDDYSLWLNGDARITNSLRVLATPQVAPAGGALTTYETNYNAARTEFVQNYFDGVFGAVNTEVKLITDGILCKTGPTFATAAGDITAATELKTTGGIFVCKYYEDAANGDLIAKSRADTLLAPRTNIDVLKSSFHKTLTDTTFTATLQEATNAVHGLNAAAANAPNKTVNPVYSFADFKKAAAQFPAFCAPADNRENTNSCEKQTVGILTYVGTFSSAFDLPQNAAPTACTGANEKLVSCHKYPDVETLEYHYIAKAIKGSGTSLADSFYPAWGMGRVTGPAEWLEFFHQYGYVAGTNSIFQSPKDVAAKLTSNPEMNWATALYRWFKPIKVNKVVEISESQDLAAAGSKKLIFVEDSYLIPSYDSFFRGDFAGIDTTPMNTMFPTDKSGFRGVAKLLWGDKCQKDVVANTYVADHTNQVKIFDGLVTKLKANDAALVEAHLNDRKDCSTVGGVATDKIPSLRNFNLKNYYAPSVWTVEADPSFKVRKFAGDSGQCFNVFIETPFSIHRQDSYARCVALKKTVNAEAIKQGAGYLFQVQEDFLYQF